MLFLFHGYQGPAHAYAPVVYMGTRAYETTVDASVESAIPPTVTTTEIPQ